MNGDSPRKESVGRGSACRTLGVYVVIASEVPENLSVRRQLKQRLLTCTAQAQLGACVVPRSDNIFLQEWLVIGEWWSVNPPA